MVRSKTTGLYEGYIYCVTNSVNQKRYIGQTMRTIAERWKQHCYAAISGENSSILYRAMRLHGVENFNVVELCKLSADSEDKLRDMLNDHESYYIAELGTYMPDGYNMTTGGQNAANVEKGVVCVMPNGDVVARYRSAADAGRMTGIKSDGITSACRYTTTHFAGGYFWYYDTDITAEIGDNIGKQELRRNIPVYQFTQEGALISMYTSPSEASLSTGVDACKIRAVCNGKRMSAGGYVWSYSDSVDEYNPQKNRTKAVKQMDMSGNTIKVYGSIRQAEDALGVSHSLISACCIGKRKSTGGYRWAFVI